ncbi:MAG: alpha/beta hydrolase [Acidimicrobiia bacterium]
MTSHADAGGVQIAWEERGSGPAVLLIHGLGYARWGWEPLIPLLAERHRVITYDNRGVGESDVPPGPYSAESMMADAVAVLAAAGVERAHVVGTSLGGMIAQQLAAGHRDRVNRLVLLSTTPGGSDAHPMPSVTVDLLTRAASLEPADALRAFVVNALGDDPDPELVERILSHRLANLQDPAGWQAQAVAGTTFDPPKFDISAPTLVIHGTSDRVVDVRNAALLGDRILDSQVVTMPGGHLMFWEYPEDVAAHILSFLDLE